MKLKSNKINKNTVKAVSVSYILFIYLIMIAGSQMVALGCKEMAENSECSTVSVNFAIQL